MNIPVILSEDICWEGLSITIYFSNNLSNLMEDTLKSIIEDWYTLGTDGCYGGVLHNMSEVWIEDSEAGLTVDMGSAQESSLELLFAAIEGFANENNLCIEKIVLGNEIEE